MSLGFFDVCREDFPGDSTKTNPEYFPEDCLEDFPEEFSCGLPPKIFMGIVQKIAKMTTQNH